MRRSVLHCTCSLWCHSKYCEVGQAPGNYVILIITLACMWVKRRWQKITVPRKKPCPRENSFTKDKNLGHWRCGTRELRWTRLLWLCQEMQGIRYTVLATTTEEHCDWPSSRLVRESGGSNEQVFGPCKVLVSLGHGFLRGSVVFCHHHLGQVCDH